MQGGDLFDHVLKHKRLPSAEAARFLHQVVRPWPLHSALHYRVVDESEVRVVLYGLRLLQTGVCV